MKKRIICIVSVLLFVFLFTVPSFAEAEADKKYVIDMADVLTDNQEESLTSSIKQAVENCKMDIVVVTVEDLEGKSTMEYADDYYDYNGYKRNGTLLLVHFENGQYARGNSWISTSGKAIKAISDENIQNIGSNITPNLLSGEYALAFTRYVESARYLIKKSSAIDFKSMAVWGVIVGLVVALIVCNVLKNQLKSVKKAADASNYIVDGSLAIAYSYDHFLYSTVSSVRKQSSSSSGGSSTHTSSSGRTHGGGGF